MQPQPCSGLSSRDSHRESSKDSLLAEEAAATLEVVSKMAPDSSTLGSAGHPAFSVLALTSDATPCVDSTAEMGADLDPDTSELMREQTHPYRAWFPVPEWPLSPLDLHFCSHWLPNAVPAEAHAAE